MASFSLPPFFLFILSIIPTTLAIDFLQNYSLPPNPTGMCTTHLKTFSNHSITTAIYTKFIQDNLNSQIFTLWSSGKNDTIIPKPSIHFYEHCSISIIIEGPHEPEWVRLNSYLRTSLFPYRSWTHSLTIIIRLYCTSSYHGRATVLPHRLYIHMINCPQWDLPPSLFPNFVFLQRPGLQWNLFLMIPAHRDIYNIHKPLSQFNPMLKRLGAGPFPLTVLGALGAPDIVMNCLETQWTEEIALARSHALKDRCTLEEFILQNLRSKFNNTFTITRLYNTNETLYKEFEWSPYGTIFLGGFSAFENWEVNYISYSVEEMMTVLYFDYFKRIGTEATKIGWSRWISPFPSWVWGYLILSMGAMTVVLSLGSGRWSFDRIYIVVASLLHQPQSTQSLGLVLVLLLLLFNTMTLFLTWIYENTVTSELIVPSKTEVILDLVDLVLDAGYKIEYIHSGNSTANHSFLFGHAFSQRNVSHKFDSSRFIPIHGTNELMKRYGDPDKKLGFLVRGSESHISNHLMVIQAVTKRRDCFRVQTPLKVSTALIAFFTAEQERFVKMMGLFHQAGLVRWWSDMDKFLITLVHKTGYWGVKDVENTMELITLSNLGSLYVLCGLILWFSIVVLFFGWELRNIVWVWTGPNQRWLQVAHLD